MFFSEKIEEDKLQSASLWRKARLFLILTLAWNIAEFFVAVLSGAAANSIALVGFGLDSAIESFASAYTLWHFNSFAGRERGDALRERQERRIHFAVGISFFLLALYIAGEGVSDLLRREGAEESIVGLVLAALSLAVMPLLGWLKITNARRLGSKALAAEGKETIACAYLSATLLAGLAANTVAGWYWLDGVTALLLVPWLVKEGFEGVRGEEEGEEREEKTEDKTA